MMDGRLLDNVVKGRGNFYLFSCLRCDDDGFLRASNPHVLLIIQKSLVQMLNSVIFTHVDDIKYEDRQYHREVIKI